MTTGRINQVTLFCTPNQTTRQRNHAQAHTQRTATQSDRLGQTPAHSCTQIVRRCTLRPSTLSYRKANMHRLETCTHSQNCKKSHYGPKIRDEFIKQRFVAQYKQRLFDSSVTFHYPCHHTKRQRPPSNLSIRMRRGFLIHTG